MKFTKSHLAKAVLAAAILLVAAACNKNVQNVNPAPSQNQSGSVTYKGQNGKTALQILKEKYLVATKTSAGSPETVISINGQTPDSSHFWAFLVNGKPSINPGTYQTKGSDTIEWRLQKTGQ